MAKISSIPPAERWLQNLRQYSSRERTKTSILRLANAATTASSSETKTIDINTRWSYKIEFRSNKIRTVKFRIASAPAYLDKNQCAYGFRRAEKASKKRNKKYNISRGLELRRPSRPWRTVQDEIDSISLSNKILIFFTNPSFIFGHKPEPWSGFKRKSGRTRILD